MADITPPEDPAVKLKRYKKLITKASIEEPFLKTGRLRILLYSLGFFAAFFGLLLAIAFIRESRQTAPKLLRNVAAYAAITDDATDSKSQFSGRVAKYALKAGSRLYENNLFDEAASEGLKTRVRLSVSIKPANIPAEIEAPAYCLLILSPTEKELQSIRIDNAMLLETSKDGDKIRALIALQPADLDKILPILAQGDIYLAKMP
jgi:hypothetical protein